MVVVGVLLLTWQAIAASAEPSFAFRTGLSADEASRCVVSSLRGRRLGANIFTLRPQTARVFDDHLISIGPEIRIAIRSRDYGSDVALYAPAWVKELSGYMARCEVPSAAEVPLAEATT